MSKVKLTIRYHIMSLLSTVTLATGVIGFAVPEVLDLLSEPLSSVLKENWLPVLLVGVVIAAINIYQTFFVGNSSNDERWGRGD